MGLRQPGCTDGWSWGYPRNRWQGATAGRNVRTRCEEEKRREFLDFFLDHIYTHALARYSRTRARFFSARVPATPSAAFLHAHAAFLEH